jgi:hypothetical protein
VRCRAGAPAEPAVLAFHANRLKQALKAPQLGWQSASARRCGLGDCPDSVWMRRNAM